MKVLIVLKVTNENSDIAKLIVSIKFSFHFAFRILIFVSFQVHLHSPHNIPRVKDLGFAVAPGSHSLVAVKVTKVRITNFVFSLVVPEWFRGSTRIVKIF